MKNTKMFYLQFLVAALFTSTTSTAMSAASPQPIIANCTENLFVSGGEMNQITIVGKTFNPKCLKIKVGSIVMIEANSNHPLVAMPDIQGVANPFANSSPAKSPQTRTMNVVGTFGYHCNNHGDDAGNGMAGVIIVEP